MMCRREVESGSKLKVEEISSSVLEEGYTSAPEL